MLLEDPFWRSVRRGAQNANPLKRAVAIVAAASAAEDTLALIVGSRRPGLGNRLHQLKPGGHLHAVPNEWKVVVFIRNDLAHRLQEGAALRIKKRRAQKCVETLAEIHHYACTRALGLGLDVQDLPKFGTMVFTTFAGPHGTRPQGSPNSAWLSPAPSVQVSQVIGTRLVSVIWSPVHDADEYVLLRFDDNEDRRATVTWRCEDRQFAHDVPPPHVTRATYVVKVRFSNGEDVTSAPATVELGGLVTRRMGRPLWRGPRQTKRNGRAILAGPTRDACAY